MKKAENHSEKLKKKTYGSDQIRNTEKQAKSILLASLAVDPQSYLAEVDPELPNKHFQNFDPDPHLLASFVHLICIHMRRNFTSVSDPYKP